MHYTSGAGAGAVATEPKMPGPAHAPDMIGVKSSPPLSERNLSDEEIARAVSGRLKSEPEEQKRAVALYVGSFMKRK